MREIFLEVHLLSFETRFMKTPLTFGHKKRQATYIAPLQPYTLAAFPPWGILQELVV